MTKTKFCKTCGKIMWDVQPTKRYCDSCIRKRNIKSAQASYRRRRDAGVLKKGKKPAAHPCLKKTMYPRSRRPWPDLWAVCSPRAG